MIEPGHFDAIVALRAKSGEFRALTALDDGEQVKHVQPLITLEPDWKKRQLAQLEAVVRHLFALGRYVMLDTFDAADRPHFGGGPAAMLAELADRFRYPSDLLEGPDVAFIPVLRADAPRRQLIFADQMCQEQGAGGALRVRSGQADVEVLGAVLERIDTRALDLDVILDLRYVPDLTDRFTEHIASALYAITRLGPFRSVSVLSGSVPRTLQQTSVWEQPRVEEKLWHGLSAAVTDLRFGDYGATHPITGGSFRSKHVSLKYTSSSAWLYARERVPDADQQAPDEPDETQRAYTFRAVCRDVAESERFAGRAFSWGDRLIAEAAAGAGEALGDSSKPVAFATSHHLAYLDDRFE